MKSRRLLALLALPAAALAAAAELPVQFREPFAKSWPIREHQHLQTKAYLDSLKPRATDSAEHRFTLSFESTAAYERSIARVREQLVKLKGWPPEKTVSAPRPRLERVGQDQHADIYRVWTEVFQGVEAYALYMVPRGLAGKAPVLIAIHGGSGCPEAVCDLDTRVNYRSFGPEAVKRGYIVYAPGILMNVSYAEPKDPRPPGADYQQLAKQATSLGLSTWDLQVFQIIEGLKALIAIRPEIDGERIGATGLSMGGGYTLGLAALWPKIKAAAPSASFRGEGEKAGSLADLGELVLKGDASRSALVPLICPRPLLIQAGEQDTVAPLEAAKQGVPRVRAYYERLGVADRFEFNVHAGGHVYENAAIFRFFDQYLK